MSRTPKLIAAALIACMFFTSFCHAQQSIRGNVIGADHQPLVAASVLLLHGKDSSLVKGALSAKNGSYIFEQIPPGSYLTSSSYSGYKDAYSSVFTVTNTSAITLPDLKITEKEINLSLVTVMAKKPLFEQKIDRMVINVASSITNTGSTVLEVLMRSPGVTVNQQNSTLSMNGKEGVFVMLNGRVNRMPANALVQMLAGMSSANIEKIELITTPPANFDAEGNAGFINIVLKKNTQYGTNGSFSVTAGYGLGGGPVAASSLNFNHRTAKWNLYGDYSFSRIKPNSNIIFYRKVLQGSNTVENYMYSDRDDFRRNHSARLGVDYELNNKTTVGMLVSGLSNMYGMDVINKSNIFLNGNLDTTVLIEQFERHPLDNFNTNFNVQHRFSSSQQLSVNVDYIYYKDANTLSYLNNLYNGSGTFLYQENMKSKKETPINFWVATTDYSQKLGKTVDMEAGAKATFSDFINDVQVEREEHNKWIIDTTFTSKHNLEESIFAAYTSFTFKLGEKTSSKMGLRYEYTNSNLGSELKKNIVDRHYGNWFPSLFISHSINENNSFNFSYSRRITRPSFNDMAPFIYFVDPNTFFSGNPALQPSIANSVKGDYLLKRFIFSLTYSLEKNTITNFAPTVDPVTNKQTLAAENQKDKKTAALTLSLPFTITKWWTMQNNIAGYWQAVNAFYKGAPLAIRQQNLNINSTQTFVLPKSFSIELTGAYQSGGLFGIYRLSSFASLNFGVQKKFGDKGGSLLFNVTDFSGPPHFKVSVDAPEHNLLTTGDLKFSTTTFKFTYMRKFGNSKVKENRNRTTGSEEERQRVQTN
jgi:outer membrane receptor protein involved in Fe transport